MRILLLSGWAMPASVLEPLRIALGVAPEHYYIMNRPLDELRQHIAADMQPGTVLVGWSLGGMLALEMAAKAVGRTTAVVTIGANLRFLAAPEWPHGYDPATFSTFQAQLKQGCQATLLRFAALATQGSQFQREEVRWLRGQLEPERQFTGQVLEESLVELGEIDSRDLWSSLELPIFSILGQQDALVPVQVSNTLRQLHSSIVYPRGVEIIEGMAHLPSFRFAEPVAEAVRGCILPVIRSWC